MNPVIVLVGRPNVGKSTLFNRLTHSRAALVADQPGLTRDRIYGAGKVGDRPYIVVDTGGLSGERGEMDGLMASQAQLAMEESDVILFLVDGRSGMSAADEMIAGRLRQLGKPVYLVLNKSEGLHAAIAGAEFQALGLGQPWAVSAAHGDGVTRLMDAVLATLPAVKEEEAEPGIKVAVVGRPNVGKSTLVNRILGEERVLAFDQPGTTRDSIYVPYEHAGRRYTLIDTAGVRRRHKVFEAIEKFSVVKTLQAIEDAHVIVLVLDARDGVTDQDASLAGFILESGRALVMAINKWDGLDADQRAHVKREIERKLSFLNFAVRHFISALRGTGVDTLLPAVDRAYQCASQKLSTPQLTRLLADLTVQHAPPLVRGRRIKLRYAHQGGQNPPLIVIHGNQVESVPASYRRYLTNAFRATLKLEGTPLRIEFKGSENPYREKKNVLTPRQIEKRRRFIRRIKKS
ncbi:MAG: ribosome biogenesis GTPase Der [Gammaproteobacteria bacterium]|nr:ribosome biogenesis GTPase Der [Gammaproteobacteria bacterium]